MRINKIIAGTSAVALSLSMTSVAFAATASNTINLEVEVQDTLVFDCYDSAGGTGDTTVTLGTAASPGNVTAGTPAVGESTCEVTTNDDAGYYLTAVDDNAGVTGVLTHTMPNNTTVEIVDTGNGLSAWDWNGSVATGSVVAGDDVWANGTTGLGFSVMTIPANETANNNLNAASANTGSCSESIDTNKFSAFPDAAEAIAGVVTYQAGTTTTEMCYKVDVPSTQQSGAYTGSVTYTATTDATTLP